MAGSVAAYLLPGMGIQQLPKRLSSARMTCRTLLTGQAYTPRPGACDQGYFLQSNATITPTPAAIINDCSGLART